MQNKPAVHRQTQLSLLIPGITAAILCMAIAFPQISFAQTGGLTLTWDANSESDLAGYKVYRRTALESYNFIAPLASIQGNVPTYVDTGLTVGQEYFYVVTAFDTSTNESAPSIEASGTVPPPVIVPDVIGLTQAVAESAVISAGLLVGTITTTTSATMPAGSVITQAPAAGASAAPGSAGTVPAPRDEQGRPANGATS